MNEMELNLKNLFRLGVTPEILKNDFLNWIQKNEDIFIDFDNKVIYTGISSTIKEIETFSNILKTHLKTQGYCDDEINSIIKSESEKMKSHIKNFTNNIQNDATRNSYNFHMLKYIRDNINELKEEFFKSQINDLLSLNKKSDSNIFKGVSNDEKIEKNPYPRFFTNDNAYQIFKNLLSEFGNTNENLANYSFVFRRMIKDNYIFKDVKQLEFLDILSTHDISLDRIKPQSQIGKSKYRDSIYLKCKQLT